MAPPSLGTAAAEPRGSLGTGTSVVQSEGNATVHLPANAFKHHPTPLRQGRPVIFFFFFLAERSHVYYFFFFFIPASAIPPPSPPLPPKANKPESTECALQKSWLRRPAARGHAVLPARCGIFLSDNGAYAFDALLPEALFSQPDPRPELGRSCVSQDQTREKRDRCKQEINLDNYSHVLGRLLFSAD